MRKRIIEIARSWIGTPYLHQASLKGIGCDCLGLVRGIWRECYGEEPELPPPYAPDWAESGSREALCEAARRHMLECQTTDYRPGDLLLCRWQPHLPARHAVIAAPGSAMIHAQQGAVVCEVAMSPWWQRRMAYAFSFPEPSGVLRRDPEHS